MSGLGWHTHMMFLMQAASFVERQIAKLISMKLENQVYWISLHWRGILTGELYKKKKEIYTEGICVTNFVVLIEYMMQGQQLTTITNTDTLINTRRMHDE